MDDNYQEDGNGNNSIMAQSAMSTSYTIISPRAFSSPRLNNMLEQSSTSSPSSSGPPSAERPSHSNSQHHNILSNSSSSASAHHNNNGINYEISNVTAGTAVTTPPTALASPSTIIRAVSPPTPAPSPQPAVTLFNNIDQQQQQTLTLVGPSAIAGGPGTPVSPTTAHDEAYRHNSFPPWSDRNNGHHNGPNSRGGGAGGERRNSFVPDHEVSVFSHQRQQEHDMSQVMVVDPEVEEALFAAQFIESVVAYFPRLRPPARRALFTSLLPSFQGEDLLHLSQLISPYLRRDFLAELPCEIALQILSYLENPKDLVRASQVSKSWRNLVSDEQNWKLMLERFRGNRSIVAHIAANPYPPTAASASSATPATAAPAPTLASDIVNAASSNNNNVNSSIVTNPWSGQLGVSSTVGNASSTSNATQVAQSPASYGSIISPASTAPPPGPSQSQLQNQVVQPGPDSEQSNASAATILNNSGVLQHQHQSEAQSQSTSQVQAQPQQQLPQPQNHHAQHFQPYGSPSYDYSHAQLSSYQGHHAAGAAAGHSPYQVVHASTSSAPAHGTRRSRRDPFAHLTYVVPAVPSPSAVRRASALSPTARPFESRRPLFADFTSPIHQAPHVIAGSPDAAAGSAISTSSAGSMIGSHSEGELKTRITSPDHQSSVHQSPLVERTRRNKGKARATSISETNGHSSQAGASGSGGSSSGKPVASTPTTAAPDAATGTTNVVYTGMPTASNSGTVGLLAQNDNLHRTLAGGHAFGIRGLGVITQRGFAATTPRTSANGPGHSSSVRTGSSLRDLATQPRSPPPVVPPPQDLTTQFQHMSLLPPSRAILIAQARLASVYGPDTATLLKPTAEEEAASAHVENEEGTVAYEMTRRLPVHLPTHSAYFGPQLIEKRLSPSIQLALERQKAIAAAAEEEALAAKSGVAPVQRPYVPPARHTVMRSDNPFGIAQTNISYTQKYLSSKRFRNASSSSTASLEPPSYKTQFKKAYLTESNWLKGPGRILSRQTSSDDGVVTSLGFDNEWIIVGMATNQIHVFDAKTGAYVQQLVGHSLGVWCLVLVSKGGQRLDKDGKRTKSPRMSGLPNEFCKIHTNWESDTDSEFLREHEIDRDDSGGLLYSYAGGPASRQRTSTGGSSGMERVRSASARPPDKERFFAGAGDSLRASPNPDSGGGGQASSGRPGLGARAASSGQPSTTSNLGNPGRSGKRPSSFCGMPSSSTGAGDSSSTGSTGPGINSSGFPFGGDGPNISPQQAAACGTAQGWGQPGAVVVSGGCDRDVRVWDVETGRCIHLLRGHLSTVRCIKVLDGRPIAISGSRDNTLRVWDIERGVLLNLLSGHTHSVRCIEISGNKVVSGSYDATCKIWDVDTGECLHTLQGHQHQIYAVAFDGVRVASGSLDSTVRIWSAKNGECLALLQGHTSLVGQLQLTDSLLVTGGSDGRVIVFSLSTFECLHRLCAHDNSVTCLQFNDRFMVTGGNDGRVKLWDRPSGKLIRDLAEPCEAVWRVTFREDKCVLLCKRGGRTIMEVRTFAPFDEEL